MIKPTKKGSEIIDHLNSVNIEPWYYIYEKHIWNKSEKNSDSDSSEENSE